VDRIIERGILYDFYGELLTDHQKEVYEGLVYNDMSLGEIAGEYNISRQAAHDLIKRCDKILENYENRLHLIKKFESIKSGIEKINSISSDAEVKALAARILEEI